MFTTFSKRKLIWYHPTTSSFTMLTWDISFIVVQTKTSPMLACKKGFNLAPSQLLLVVNIFGPCLLHIREPEKARFAILFFVLRQF